MGRGGPCHHGAMPDVLGNRALNRATLERQHLLDRTDDDVLDVVRHLVGLQAQVPLDPYTALWSRVRGFDPAVLAQLLIDREVVRIVVMRGTIHLLTGDDALLLRPLARPVLDQEMANHSEYKADLKGLDLEPVLAFARPLLSDQALSARQLRAALLAAFPDRNPGALALACRNRLALVQVPPRGVWGKSLQPTLTTLESWVGRPLVSDPPQDLVVLRYLAAFGPASATDLMTWSRFPTLRPVIDQLRPQLRTFHDERGRELLDLPDAPRPDPDVPAPVRYLPEYDNALLAYQDRSRFTAEGLQGRFADATGPIRGTVLHDGLVTAVWHVDQDDSTGVATLVVEHLGGLTKKARSAIEAEGRRFARFKADQATEHEVRLVALP